MAKKAKAKRSNPFAYGNELYFGFNANGQEYAVLDSMANWYYKVVGSGSGKMVVGKGNKFANGGKVQAFEPGGKVLGPGTSTSDSIPAYLSDGEYVFSARAVDNAGGANVVEGWHNALRRAKGGSVSTFGTTTKPDNTKSKFVLETPFDTAKRIYQETNKQVVKISVPPIRANFDTNSYDLNESQKLELQDISKQLSKYKLNSVIVQGHTDSVGKPKDNDLLSQNRAKAIASYLSNFVPGTSFIPVGYGEYRPLVPNTNAANMAQNRRAGLFLPDQYKTIYPEFNPKKHTAMITGMGKFAPSGGSLSSMFDTSAGSSSQGQMSSAIDFGKLFSKIKSGLGFAKGGSVSSAPHAMGMSSFGSKNASFGKPDKKQSFLNRLLFGIKYSGGNTKVSKAEVPFGPGNVIKGASRLSKIFGSSDIDVLNRFIDRPLMNANSMAYVLDKAQFGDEAGTFYRGLSNHDMAAIAGYTRVSNPALKMGKAWMDKFASTTPFNSQYTDMTVPSSWAGLASRWKKGVGKDVPYVDSEAALPYQILDPALKVGEFWRPDILKSVTKELDFAKHIAAFGGTGGGETKAIAKIMVDPKVKGIADFRSLIPGHGASRLSSEYTEGAIAPFTKYVLEAINKNAHHVTDERAGVSHLIDEYVFRAIETAPYREFLDRGLSIKSDKFDDLLPIVKKANGGLVKNKMSSPTYSLPSFDTGIDYLPKDMIAQLHEGERVLTKEENKNFSAGGTITNNIIINGTDLNKKEIAQQVMIELDRVQNKNNKSNRVQI